MKKAEAKNMQKLFTVLVSEIKPFKKRAYRNL